jgi:tetratricopeptide (TPR) repeat protein
VDHALSIEPNLPEADVALGFYYYWCQTEYDQALKHFGRAYKKLPNNTKVLEGIAFIQRRLGNCDAALPSLQKALVLSPRDIRIISEIGNTFTMMRKYDVADLYYDRGISYAPDQIYLYQHKAENYLLWDGNTQRANAILQRAPKTEDESIQFDWFTLYSYSRNYDAARNALESMDENIHDTTAHFFPKDQLIGFTYLLSNQKELAISHLRKAKIVLQNSLKQKPLDPRMLSSLGLVNAGLGLKRDAQQNGKLAVEKFPIEHDSVEGVDRVMDLAKIYVLTGDYDAAMDQLEIVLSRPAYVSIALIKLDPVFEPLKTQPRFSQLEKKFS